MATLKDLMTRSVATWEEIGMIFIIWPAPWAGKMNWISCYDWLPEQARWSYLACSGYGLCPARKINHALVSHLINPLLTKLVGHDGWISASFFSACLKELRQYPAILTSRLVNNQYVMYNGAIFSALLFPIFMICDFNMFQRKYGLQTRSSWLRVIFISE